MDCRAGKDRGCVLCTATTEPGGLKADFFQNLPLLLLLADFVLDGIEAEEEEEEDIASIIKKSN